ncbi:MAG: DUF5689 domain-containing protein [Bacteroidota bacterium]
MALLKKFFVPITLLAVLTGFWGCVDFEFDEPAIPDLPNLQANTTIAEVKALHTIGQNDFLIEDDLIIRGVVAADDESGNYFKQIAIQDETGGLLLRLNRIGINGDFPVGREVFVRLQGLYIGDFAGAYQINGAPDSQIEENLIEEFVIGGAFDQPLEPEVVSLAQLQNAAFFDEKLSTLIQLDNVEFLAPDAGETYADAANKFSLNRTLVDCNGQEILVRTSGFADFAAELTPEGNGSLIAILSVFNDTKQLTVRDENDVDLKAERCSESGEVTGDPIDIADVRELYATGTTIGPNDRKIVGVVISDKNTANVVGLNLFVQDATGGIVVRFSDDHDFDLGEEIEVNIAGQELSDFNGLVQVNNVPLGNAKSNGAGTLPTPRDATVAEIITNQSAWESTFVRISMAQLTGGGTFNGAINVVDATGSITMFTRGPATFADSPVPTGEVMVTAIVSDFNGAQIIINDPSDIVGGMIIEPEIVDIASLRNAFNGGAASAPLSSKIRGVVISDFNAGNINNQNLVIQDASGGIIVRFSDPHSFALGEDIEVVVSGQEFSEFAGQLQVNGVPNTNAVSFGNGTLPTPREATVQEVIANQDEWESTLVVLRGVTLSGNSTFDGVLSITDATGSLDTFTFGSASFSSASVPSGAVDLTGYVSEFNGTPQVLIRNLNDIE